MKISTVSRVSIIHIALSCQILLDFNYIAPEIDERGINLVDMKPADIFSLAMIFYQILFRQEPYPDKIPYKQSTKKYYFHYFWNKS